MPAFERGKDHSAAAVILPLFSSVHSTKRLDRCFNDTNHLLPEPTFTAVGEYIEIKQAIVIDYGLFGDLLILV